MKKIIVTGGCGYIGSQVVNDLIESSNYEVIVIDNLSTGSKILLNKKAKFFKVDIKNTKKIFDLVKNFNNIEAIFHFAGSLSVEESQKNPLKYYTNNVLGTKSILKICAKMKISKIIFSSTCSIFGNANGKVHEENSAVPESNYGLSKLFSEIIVKNYSIKYKFKYAILRYFNVIGADRKLRTGQISGKTLFKNLSKNIAQNNYIAKIYGRNYETKDGTCIRDYIDVNDLSKLHILSLIKLKNSNSFTLNCGYNKGYSVLDIIKFFEKKINKKIKLKFLKKRLGDVASVYSDNKKLKKIFPHWKRTYSLGDSIAFSIAWEKKLKFKYQR